MGSLVNIKDLNAGYIKNDHETILLKNISLSLMRGEVNCLLGANGIGKSTLIKTIARLIPPLNGSIVINEQDIFKLNIHQTSKLISIVFNNQAISNNLTIKELIALGRSPHTNIIGNLTKTDFKKIEEVIYQCKLVDLKDKKISEVSDGEKQRAMIARALAQDTPLLLLDEPTAFLDYPNKVLIMDLLNYLAIETGKTILMSTHDIELALENANKLILISSQKQIIMGKPIDLIKKDKLDKLFSNHELYFDKNSLKFKHILKK